MAQKIIAAGGIVSNPGGKILMIYRRKKWDLPKGKLDEGETIAECAVREVEEETGLQNIKLGELVGITTHYYIENGINTEKESHWFSMKVDGNQTLHPQLEEQIEEATWVEKQDIEKYLANTYSNIREILAKYFANSY